MKKSEVGFQLKTATMPARKSNNYQGEIDVWTADQSTIETVNGPKDRITRIEVDFGLIWENSTKSKFKN
jgi:hypothetical protein